MHIFFCLFVVIFSLSLVRGKLVRSGAKRIGLGDEHVALYGVDSVHSAERNHLHVLHRPQVRVVAHSVVVTNGSRGAPGAPTTLYLY